MIEDTDKCDNCNAECNQHKEDVFRFSVAAEMLERTTAKGDGETEQKCTVISIGFACEMKLEEKDQCGNATVNENCQIGIGVGFFIHIVGKFIKDVVFFLTAAQDFLFIHGMTSFLGNENLQYRTDEDGCKYEQKAADDSKYQIQLLFQIIALGEKYSAMTQKPAGDESQEKFSIQILFHYFENKKNKKVGQP